MGVLDPSLTLCSVCLACLYVVICALCSCVTLVMKAECRLFAEYQRRFNKKENTDKRTSLQSVMSSSGFLLLVRFFLRLEVSSLFGISVCVFQI